MKVPRGTWHKTESKNIRYYRKISSKKDNVPRGT